MAMKLKGSVREGSELVLLSRFDDAIDWEKSFPELQTLEEKLEAYEKKYDHTLLSLKSDSAPTFFVFKDPRLTTVAAAVRSKLTSVKAMIGKDTADDVVVVWDVMAIGYRELDETTEFRRDREKNIAREHMQALEENGALRELGTYLLSEILKSPNVKADTQKK
jgi:hypothetical protein